MFSHLILGLLRDGQPRHGYELMIDYGARSGKQVSAGSFYRELSRLMSDGFVRTGVNPPDADPRRIPYHITALGSQVFDRWLVSPSSLDNELPNWLLFVDRVPIDVRTRLLDRLEEDLWMRGKALARSREDALAKRQKAEQRYNPLPALVARQMKQVAAELEFLKEFRLEFEEWERSRQRASDREAAPTHAARPEQRREKGSPRK